MLQLFGAVFSRITKIFGIHITCDLRSLEYKCKCKTFVIKICLSKVFV